MQQFQSSQSNQPIPNPDHDRTGQPVVGTDRSGQPVVGTNPRIELSGRKTSRSEEIETRSFHEEAVKHDRTGRPVVETGVTHTHVHLMTARASTLKMKRHMIELGNPL